MLQNNAEKLNILIDVGHPAHVHLFKYFIRYLETQGHRVIVTSRNKDITIDLLDKHNIKHICISSEGGTLLLKLFELIIRDLKTFYLHLKYKFDMSFGTSINITHLTALFRVPSYTFSESDDSVIKFHTFLAYPFATKIIIPNNIKYNKWRKKRVTHNSSHKLAYLHPHHFKANEKVLKKYHLKENEFIIVRKSALKAHHDLTAKGISPKLWDEIKLKVSDHIIIDSKEGVENKKIDFYDMHDLLYYAKLLICDSQTMTMEAAILGTPCIRISSFSGKLNAIEELENKYGLVFSYNIDEEQKILSKIQELLSTDNLHEEFQDKRSKLLNDKKDFTDWMIKYFDSNLTTKQRKSHKLRKLFVLNSVILISFLLVLGTCKTIRKENKTTVPKKEIPPSVFHDGINLQKFEYTMDSKGIPIKTEGFINKTGYHPTVICFYGLNLAAKYRRGLGSEDLQKLEKVLSWILDNKIEKDGFITWEFYENNDPFNLKAPWSSSLTNARCAGVLLQGYSITHKNIYEINAKKAIEYLFTPVEKGGGLYTFKDGGVWFEECPSEENPSHILNGHIFAMEILDMFSTYYEENKYSYYFQNSLKTLKEQLHLYDVDYGSIYDLYTMGNKLGMGYHKIHTSQLYYLYLRTADNYFLELSKKWFELQEQSNYKIAISSPNRNFEEGEINTLNDGIYWYRSWSESSPLQIVASFNKFYRVKAINLFSVNKIRNFKFLSLHYGDVSEGFTVLSSDAYTIEEKGYNDNKGKETFVYVFELNDPIETDTFKIDIDKTSEIQLREIGFHKEMEEEYYDAMSKYKHIVKVIQSRRILNNTPVEIEKL